MNVRSEGGSGGRNLTHVLVLYVPSRIINPDAALDRIAQKETHSPSENTLYIKTVLKKRLVGTKISIILNTPSDLVDLCNRAFFPKVLNERE